MPAESFRVGGLQFVLAPGLNLLVCPSNETLALVAAAVRDALGRPGDECVLSASHWRAFAALCAQRPVGEVVVAAGMRGGRALPFVKHRLRRELESLYAPKARGPALNRTLAELGRVQKDLKALGDPAVHVAELEKKLAALSSRADSARAQLERLEDERALFSRLCDALPELVKVEALEAEHRSLFHLAQFPRDGVDRLQHLKADLLRVEAKKAELDARASALEGEAQDAGRPDADGVVDRIGVLLDVQRLWEVQLRALPDRIDAVSHSRAQVEQQLAQAEQTGKATVVETAAAATAALAEGRRVLEQRRVFATAATAVRERVESEVRRLTNEALSLSPTLSSAQVHAQLAALSELPSLHERVLSALAALAATRAERRKKESAAEPLPTPKFPLPFALGAAAGDVALSGAGVAFGSGTLAVLCGAAGVVGLGAIGYAFRALAHRHQRDTETWRARDRERQAEVGRLSSDETHQQEHLERARKALERAESEAGCAHDATRERLEARTHALKLLLAQVQRREDVARQMEAYAALMAMVSQEEMRARVDRHVAEARLSGLERELAPGTQESGPHRLVPLLKKRALHLRVEEAALGADWKACARAGELVLQAARTLDVSVRDLATVPIALESLREALAHAADEQRTQRARRLEVEAARAHVLSQRADLADAIRRLLQDGHAPDEAAFARHSLEAQRLDRVDAELAHARKVAEDAAGMPLQALRARVAEEGGPHAVTRQRTRLAERTTRLSGQVARLQHERERVDSDLASWRRGDAVEALRKREHELQAQADAFVAEWAKARLAYGLVERRMNLWRASTREKVLALASRELGRLTGGAYVHAGLESNDDASLFVTDGSLQQHKADALVPGVRALLYLAFRLAAVQERAESDPDHAPPLLFEGALTGFSQVELTRIAEVLSRMGEQQQVIVLTVQPLVRELFEAQGAHGLEVEELGGQAA